MAKKRRRKELNLTSQFKRLAELFRQRARSSRMFSDGAIGPMFRASAYEGCASEIDLLLKAARKGDWADKAMIAGLPVTSVERSAAFWKRDAAYIAAAANSADILAQRLLDIGKLPDDATMKDVRKILEGR